MSRKKTDGPLPVVIDPDIAGGIPVFRGTRVPVQTLFDYLADGYTIEEFANNFPAVDQKDIIQLLMQAARYLKIGMQHGSHQHVGGIE